MKDKIEKKIQNKHYLSAKETFFFDAIAIGSSTGGPEALSTIFEGLQDFEIRQPIFITQHMPPSFSSNFAKHLSKISGKECVEAEDNMLVENSGIYVAPGGYHMTVKTLSNSKKTIIKLLDSEPENFCKPSIEPMVRSMIKAFKGKILEVILTGMGNDGHKSAFDLVASGGKIVVQDKASSVVWGMPGIIANAGLSSEILPLKEIASYIKNLVRKS